LGIGGLKETMTKIIDARGLACPQPVILVRKGLIDNSRITTIVDDETAQQNVTRMAEKAGCRVQSEKRSDGIYLDIDRGGSPIEEAAATATVATIAGPLVLNIPSEFMGRGDEELGNILMRAFFHTIVEIQPSPDIIIFLNSGVKLAIKGSPILEDLQALAGQGKQILICGTCLGHYELKDQVAVGVVSNMYTIAEILLRAGKVINL
jgi:selenium metabolism protein YedF